MGEVLRFGDAELRLGERQLRVRGQVATVGSRAFDLLAALVARSDRVVSKNELLELVWPGLVVEENNLQVHVSALRKLIGPHAIATIPGRGYQFTAELNAAAPSPVAPALPPMAGNLEAPPAALIGRDDELKQLLADIRSHRLVSVIGAAGMGKTALALAAAHALKDSWPDGAWFVALGPLAEPAKVSAVVAQALHLPSSEPVVPPEVVAAALEHRSLLLVLDNCEHLIAEVPKLVSALQARAPGVRVLATSQELLNVAGEKVFKLGPLGVPAPEAAAGEFDRAGALQLFAQRAQLVDPRFRLDHDNAETVAAICRQLDGSPLAIELAAARLRLLGLQGLLARLSERFRVLTGGSRSAMRRHQTLLAAFEWSHALLTPAEQVVFRRLGVFVGGFTLELCQAVAADDDLDAWAVVDALAGLADKSLVTVSADATPRYALLETARALALEKLAAAGETTRLLDTHGSALLAQFEKFHELRHGESGMLCETDYVDRYRHDMDNLRAALAWCACQSGDVRVAIGLAAACAEPMMMMRLSVEALQALKSVASQAEVAGPERATRLWIALCIVGVDRGLDDRLYDEALERAERGCLQIGWRRARFRVLLQKCWRRTRHWQLSDAEEVLRQAVEIEQPGWPAWLHSDRLNTEAELAIYRGDSAHALDLQQQATLALDGREEPRRRWRASLNVAVSLNNQGEWNQAADRLVGLIEKTRGLAQSTVFLAWAYGHLVLALLSMDRFEEARGRLQQALSVWRVDGTMQLALLTVPRLAIATGRVDDALKLLGAEVTQDLYGPLATRFREETLRLALQAERNAERRERLMKEGESLDFDEIWRLYLDVLKAPAEDDPLVLI